MPKLKRRTVGETSSDSTQSVLGNSHVFLAFGGLDKDKASYNLNGWLAELESAVCVCALGWQPLQLM